jgi:hypothetical protein
MNLYLLLLSVHYAMKIYINNECVLLICHIVPLLLMALTTVQYK